jgi:hypothetical protein
LLKVMASELGTEPPLTVLVPAFWAPAVQVLLV